jgi:hypothetical protein
MRPLHVSVAMVLLSAAGGAFVPELEAAPVGASTSCAPGTFDDTEKVVMVIDKTVGVEMKRLERVRAAKILGAGDSKTVQVTLPNGVIIRTTVSRTVDGTTYNFEQDMAHASPSPSFVQIATASRTNAGTVNGVHTVNKQISFDYDARAAFLPTFTTGHFDADVVHVSDSTQPAPGTQDTTTVTFAGITVMHSDPHGPRSGSYTHVGESAIGRSLDFQASVPVPCPGSSVGPVEITVQRRHVDNASGERNFRRDALVTGGNLTTGQKAIKFVCGSSTQTATGATVVASSYTLRKIENADGTTQTFSVKFQNETSPNCNPAFGPLVSSSDKSTDAPFTHPVTFPGEW